MKKLSLCMLACALGIPTVTLANDHEEKQPHLETVTVTGTWIETPVREVVGSITAIEAEEIDKQLATNIADLVRYEPGVYAQGQGRFGLSGFAVRGLGDDRVLMLLDGVPIADEFSFGPFLSSGRNTVDLDSLKRVEILKGPASALYGSDALAGVVQFFSKTPMDYLAADQRGDIKLGYSSADQLRFGAASIAFGDETLAGYLSAKFQAANELATAGDTGGSGDTRTEADPQDLHASNVLARVQYRPSDALELIATADYFTADGDIDVLSTAGTFSRGTLINSETAEDEQERTRLSINAIYNAENDLVDRVKSTVYWQQSETIQNTAQARLGAISFIDPTPIAQSRTRDSYYEQQVLGMRTVLSKVLEGSVSHDIQYGLDYSLTESETLREGQTLVSATGDVVPEFSVFPVRDFPLSKTRKMALFASDVITLGDSGWKVIPGVRFDSFEHDVTSDALYLAGSGGQEPEDYDDSNIAVKLGVSKQISEGLNVYAQYAEGFRIPAFDDVNVAFTNFAGGYTTLSNPDLKPEQSESIELGLKGHVGDIQLELAVFNNQYQDFIESLSSLGFNPVTQLLEFQAQNIEDVTIRGAEAKLLMPLSEAFTINASFGVNDSEDKSTGEELASVAPAKVVIGLDWQATETMDFSLIASHSASKKGLEEYVDTDAYTTVDFIASAELNHNLSVNAGIFNIFDETYWQFDNLAAREQNDNLERYSQPGINASVNIKYTY